MLLDLRVGALVDAQSGTTWDAKQVACRIDGRIASFARQHVGRGQRVFLHFGNRPSFFIDLMALWRLGACAVPVDPRLTAFELERQAAAVAPTHAICGDSSDRSARTTFDAMGIRCLDPDAGTLPPGAHVDRGLPHLDDDALILFTSGTTGAPKGVVHTHRSLRARWNAQREVLGVAPFARTLCIVPTNFAWGLIGNCLYAWLSGQTLVVAPAFRNDVVLQLGALCDEHEITYLPLVPALWKMALRMARPPRKGTLIRASSGTSPLNAQLWTDIGAWCATRDVLNIYGITETGWIAGCSSIDVTPADGLIGRPWGCGVKILAGGPTDDGAPWNLRACQPDEVGHVWVQTASLMSGYYGRDDDSRRAIVGTWFCTGDLGSLDAATGALRLAGRDKDMISVGGIKVYPDDLDAILQRHPDVADSCAFGVDDPLQGESVAVAVVLKPAIAVEPPPVVERLGAVYQWLLQHLAQHQLPRRWFLLSDIARSPRGKLIRADVAKSCETLKPIEHAQLERQRRLGASP